MTNYKVEADITAGTANDRVCYVAVYGSTTGDKQAGDAYRFSYSGKSGKFLLTRNATGASGNKADLVTGILIADYFSDYKKGETIRMSITAVTCEDYVHLICEVTYKGETKEIINYRDDSDGRYTCGLPGFGLQQQNSSLDNVKVVKVDESIIEVPSETEPEFAPGTVLYEDNFATDTKYKEALGSTGWQTFKQPIWENGKLISGDYTDSTEAKYALLNGLEATKWTDYKVEADITAGTASDRVCYVAAYGRTTGDKQAGDIYQFAILGKSGYFLLRRNATGKSGNKADLQKVAISTYFSNYKKGDTIHMSITAATFENFVVLICEATYKGTTHVIFSYSDTTEGRYTCGLPGFGMQLQNSSLDNVKVVKIDKNNVQIPSVGGTSGNGVLYEDNFATPTKYVWALGNTSWQTFNQPIWKNGKLISGDYTESSEAKYALLNGLGGDKWTDYKVEADITAGTASDRVCYVAAYGRTTGDKLAGDTYQFAILGKSEYFLLRRNATGKSGNKTDLQKVAIASYFRNYKKGDTIRMAITAVTFDNFVTLICEATYKGKTQVIFAYNDTSAGRYTCGMPGFGMQGLGEMSRIYHKLYRTRLCRGKYRDAERFVVLNHWEAYRFAFDEEKLVEMARKGAEIGVDLFVLDDGWFGKRDNDRSSLGDWKVHPKKLPNGLGGLAKKINDMGLRFGLWFEPEMISPVSELYEKHPDWALHTPGRECSQYRFQLVLDLSRKDVCDYVIESLSDILNSANIEYVKWDMNRYMSEAGSALLPPDRQGEVMHRYMLGLYYIMETLVSRFPDILFESCASGGGRFDPGMLYYMPQVWTSDCSDAVSRLSIQYGTSIVYPYSTMAAHVSAVPNHQMKRTTTFDMRCNVAMVGQFGFELDLNNCTEEELDAARNAIIKYKKLGPVFHKGTNYRLCSPFETDVSAIEFVSEDENTVICCINSKFAVANAERMHIRLQGLSEGSEYVLEDNGRIYGGDYLMNYGVPFCNNAENKSVVLIFTKKQ